MADGREVDRTVVLSSGGVLLNITPLSPLPRGSRVCILLTSSIEDLTGTPLVPLTFNFTVWGELRLLYAFPERVNTSGEVRFTFSNKLSSVEGAALRLEGSESELKWRVEGRNITVLLEEAPPGEGFIVVYGVVDVFGQNLTEVKVPYSVPTASSGGGRGGEGRAIYIYLIPIIMVAAALLTAAAVKRKKRA